MSLPTVPTTPTVLSLPTLPLPPTPTEGALLAALQDGGAVAAPPPQGSSPGGTVAAPPGEGGTGGGASEGGGLMAWLPFIVIGVVFWMLIIGPERRNRKKRDEMLGALKKGDKVMTTGGLHGRVAEVRDDVVILDTGDVRLKFSRAAVQGIVGDTEKS